MDTTTQNGSLFGPFRFNLRSLLLATALLSIPLTLLQRLGSYFLVSIIFSVCLILICRGVYNVQIPKRLLIVAGLAFPIGVAVAFFQVMVSFSVGGSGTLLLHTLINFGVCLVCVLLHSSRRILTFAICIAAIAPYTLKVLEIQKAQREFEQLIIDHPLESLESRLAFESDEIFRPDSEASQVSTAQLSEVVLNNLIEQEQRYGRRREWTLTELHENYSTHFAAAAGFGFMRMRHIYPDDLTPEPIDFVQLPLPVDGNLLGVDSSTGAGTFHQIVSKDVLNRDKIGYVHDREHVAGFQSHSPSYLTQVIGEKTTCDEEKTNSFWQLTRLELVSMLRHSPPRVYVSKSLPKMDELDSFELRKLSDFEYGTLANLRAQQDIVISVDDGRILMVGALRASRDCLGCHEGKQGKLLAAFSYELARLTAE